jgi:hypothetical protein
MYYVVVLQILCGCFAAFVAARKGRSPLLWGLLGVVLPVVGVALALVLPTVQASAGSAGGGRTAQRRRVRPKRCRGSYIPDCFGCPHFRRVLFDAEPSAGKKGFCEFFAADLYEESGSGAPHAAPRER